LLITAILLVLADLAKDTHKSVGFSAAFIIGISQAIAILPGISRPAKPAAPAPTVVLVSPERRS
jgi:undecaprenyl pyrophosphate phosphatase UppP